MEREESFASEGKLFGDEEGTSTNTSALVPDFIKWLIVGVISFIFLLTLLNSSPSKADYSEYFTKAPNAQAVIFSANW